MSGCIGHRQAVGLNDIAAEPQARMHGETMARGATPGPPAALPARSAREAFAEIDC
jgi:hypothetical protein